MGRSFASRVAGSALTAVGLPELITQTLEAYEGKALELLREPQELAGLKEKLRRQRLGSALFDTARFTRDLESAYLTMHERATQGLPPAALSV
jgi:predicted O-linked N-acetylglucosamine transferase (SPINDLY family)